MKKGLPLLILAAFLAVGRADAQSVRLKTLSDSVSYALGIDAAEQFRNSLPDFDSRLVTAGIKDALEEHKGRMAPEEAREFLMDYMRNRLPAINLQRSEQYLADVQRKNAAIRRTESGLLYEIVDPGSGERPENDRDTVVAHYEGRLMSGKVFDSSRERAEPLNFRLGQVIDGWTEGMKLIGKGGKIRLWIPPGLAYGERGMQIIPPNEALYFEVELIDINP